MKRYTSAVYATATNSFFTNSFRYATNADWLIRVDYPYGKWLSLEYDSAGRQTRRTDQDGHIENYFYNAQGRMQRITDAWNNIIVEYVFDAAGRLSRKTLGNGVYTTYEYDSSGCLTNLVNQHPSGTNISRFAYTYDLAGRRTSMKTFEGTTKYGYDPDGQLTSVLYPDGRTVAYVYDETGNRKRVVNDGLAIDYSVNSLNQYTDASGVSYTYDADGNLTGVSSIGTFTRYTYDVESRLIRVESGAATPDWPQDICDYAYDALGGLAKRFHNGVELRYTVDPLGSGIVLAEFEASGQQLARYEHGYGLLARRDASDTAAYYTFDGLGNTSELTDSAGCKVNSYRYEPFGESSQVVGLLSNEFRFMGEFGVVSQADGTIQTRLRGYSPSLGRFMSKDPVRLANGDPNPYVYAGNLPTIRVDPIGARYLVYQVGVPGVEGLNGMLIIDNSGISLGAGVGYDLGLLVTDERAVLSLWVASAETGPGNYRNSASMTYAKGTDVFTYDEKGIRQLYGFGLYGGVGIGVELLKNWELLYLTPPGMAYWGMMQMQPYWWDMMVKSYLAGSWDPNDKLTAGYGAVGYINGDALLPYVIRFENKSTATAPAQLILVTDQLSPDLDLDTFELNEIALGSHVIVVPPGSSYYATLLDLGTCYADIEVYLDPETRMVTATMMAVDPLTGWMPEDVMTGLLPPNDSTGRGEGYIAFTVSPKPGLANGTVILNEATITFDWNDPINTPIVTNTLDILPPSSQVAALPATMTNRTFTVTWSGQDNPGGAGIASYDLFVSDNGGDYRLVVGSTTNTLTEFTGAGGHTYSFVSVARDNAGNLEPISATADTQTFVVDNSPPTLAAIADRTANVGALLTFTNTATDADLPVQTLTFNLEGAPAGATINPTNGIFRWTPDVSQASTTNQITVRVRDSGTPSLSAARTFTVTVMPYVQVALGTSRVIMLAGETTNIPVQVIASIPLSELGFSLSFMSGRLTNFVIMNSASTLQWTNIVQDTPSHAGVYMKALTNQFIQGTQQVFEVSFTAVADQASAFIPVTLDAVNAIRQDGAAFTSGVGLGGRLVVIGRQPLLEALLATDGQRSLALYGRPGASYAIESATNSLVAPQWAYLLHVPMADVVWQTGGLDTTPAQIFYRAYEFKAHPPLLEIGGGSGPVTPLLLYGRAGSSYQLHTAPSLSTPTAWTPEPSFTLTNSFRFMDWTNAGEAARFFRVLAQ